MSLIFALALGTCVMASELIVPWTQKERDGVQSAVAGKLAYVAPPSLGPYSATVPMPESLAKRDAKRPTFAWTQLMLSLFVKHKTSPNRAARALAIVHVAMHDAWVFTNDYCNVSPCPDNARALAVSTAAARTLRYIFTAEESQFDRFAHEMAGGSQTTFSANTLNWLAVGQRVGDIAVAHAEIDGAAKGWNGSNLEYYGEGRLYGPGTWEPTGPYFYYPPEEPFAPNWRPWALSSPNQFRPTPPAFGSDRYLKDLREVVTVSRDTPTEQQKKIAFFWADGRGSITPPGHWNQIALTAVQASSLSDHDTVRLFTHLNVALADAFIAAWDAKYAYWTIRPVTAAKKLLGIDWKTLVLTPPFPSYVSGHATFSGAAAVVLSAYLPTQGSVFNTMAEEAAMSRLYGGIHFRFDNDDGLTLGRRVGVRVLARYSI